jgi:predicted RNA binding protein YcfA (HicA-like mRNA interferase family)
VTDKVPEVSYTEIVAALRRGGWVVVRQKGSHIRMQRTLPTETLKITVPAHKPVKRSTLAHLLKHARLTIDEFRNLLH